MATQITTVAGFTSGDDTISTDLLQDFFIDGLAGDDNITLEEAASNFTLKGAGGDDLITADSDISASSLLKGGAADDTFQFAGAVSGSSIYGGKGADSLYFARTLSGGVIAGDTGADRFTFDGKISSGALISGGNGDDSFVVNERITDSTIKGGESRDSVDINENSAGSKIATGTDNDVVLVRGKHSNLEVKGGAGDDTFDVETNFTGSGNKFYGGKGEDSIELNTTAAVAVYADKDDDVILFQAVAAVGASAFGGEGADTINLSALPASSSAVIKGNKGNDSILASDTGGADTIAQTIFGGQGNDTIIQDTASNQNNYFYGDKGDDVIDHDSDEQSLLSGGDGADSIVLSTASTDTGLAHTVIGGAGVDTLDVEGTQTLNHGYGTTTTLRYIVPAETATLKYSSFAEFFTSGDIVDDINIEGNNQAVVAEVAEKLTFTDADEFDRASFNSAARDATREGLVIKTASTVTDGSSIVFDATAADYVFGIDLSAGTTGNSTIDVSAETGTALGMLLKGGSGRNTIKGTAGLDVIEGGKNDVLLGNASADIIFANDGKDSVEGGTGADTIDFASNLTFQDTVKGGDDTDQLRFTAASATATNDLDNVSGIEAVVLGNAATKIVLTDNFAASGSITFNAAAMTTSTSTLNLDADLEEDATLVVTGGSNNDTIKGTDLADSIFGAAGADSLAGGTGADKFVFSTGLSSDEITDFSGNGGQGDTIEFSFGALNNNAAGVKAGATTAIGGGTGIAIAGAGAVGAFLDIVGGNNAKTDITTANLLNITISTFADTDAVETFLAGADGIETDDTTGVSANDAVLLQYKGTDANYYLGAVIFDQAVGNGTDVAPADISVVEIAEIGTTAAVAADLSFIA